MERTKNKKEEEDREGMVRWRKTGGGTFRMGNGKIIKPNQVFWAKPEDIPEGFRDVIVPLTEVPADTPVEFTETKYELQARSPGWYDIVDGQGKVLNESAMREDKAREMITSLMEG